jgi:antitoxin component of MazEF toxin-antitoxin module
MATVIGADAQSLLSATYGSGAKRVDVTDRLQSLTRGGSLTVQVSNQNMGVDPAPRQPKDLRIQARDNNGQVHDYLFREGDVASLQVSYQADARRGYRDDDDDRRGRDWDRHDRDDLVIEHAFYGINNATAEVTGHLQDLVRGNSLAIRVDNETLGVDPAHDHGKVLCVYYRYRGERRAAIVRETERLVIP